MSTESCIYAELDAEGCWRPAEITDWGKPLEFGEETRNETLYDVLGGIYSGTRSGGHYISRHRGLPIDVSDPIRRAAESFMADRNEAAVDGVLRFHALGAGFVMADEIFNFDWDARIEVSHQVSRSVATRFTEGNDVRPTWDWPEWDPDGIPVRWLEPLRTWGFSVDDLSKLRMFGPPDRVRLVFWFF